MNRTPTSLPTISRNAPFAARPAVFLDRDGVLNRAYLHADGKSHPPASPVELEIMPGVPEACTTLHQAGYLLVVVTNQPDVARGTQRRHVVEAINGKLQTQILVDDIRICYHDNADNCTCRKPKPGMLRAAARDWAIDLTASFLVGDRWTDIEAGKRAGCKTFLVQHDLTDPGQCNPDFKVNSLLEAANWILQRVQGATLQSQGWENHKMMREKILPQHEAHVNG